MNDRELAGLKSLSGPSKALKAQAELYMKDYTERKKVDDYDAANATQIGKKLKRVFYGQPEEVPTAPAPVAAPSAVEMAAAIKQFPKSRCIELFKRSANTPGEVASTLSKSDYQTAKLAAGFFGVLDSNNTASVRFSYETSRARREAREAREAATKAADKVQAEKLPPGISRQSDGGLVLTDEAAFTAWKKEKSEHSEALAFLENATK